VIDLDQRLEHWVVGHRTEPFDSIFISLSRVGSYGIVWLILAVLTAWYLRRPAAVPFTLIAYFVASAAADAIKALVERDRPGENLLLPEPASTSFPSGHAATSFACAATLARFVPTRVAVVFYVLAAAIAYSRVYVGVHFPLDVLAGAALGLLVATALRLLPATLRGSQRAPRAG
jgi:undecaprenyl-diphosphatase